MEREPKPILEDGTLIFSNPTSIRLCRACATTSRFNVPADKPWECPFCHCREFIPLQYSSADDLNLPEPLRRFWDALTKQTARDALALEEAKQAEKSRRSAGFPEPPYGFTTAKAG